jgi:DNA-binding NtrC family response regulator/tetratricopeptide (TPR) repeat protein
LARKRPEVRPDGPGPEESGRNVDAGRRGSALADLRMGALYLESDNFSDAMDYFLRVEREDLRSTLTDAEVACLYARLARCCLGLGRHDDAMGHAAKAASFASQAGDLVARAEADVIVARVEARSGRFRRSLRAAERAYAVLRKKPDSALLAEASKALGTAHAELGNMTGARDCLVDCLVCNRRLGNEEGVAGAYNNLGILAKRSGDLSSAIDYFEKALEIDLRLGRPAAVARRLNNLGVALYRSARWKEAREKLERAREIYSGLGATRDIVAVESALGNLCRVRRDWSGARRYFSRVLRVSQEEGYRRAEALALEFLGDLEKDMGRHARAKKALDQALACAHRLSSMSDVIGEVLRRRAEVLFAMGRLDEAERDCNAALDLCRRIGDRMEEGAALRVLAAISYMKGQRSAARVLSARARRVQSWTGESFELARTALTDGSGLAHSGPVDDATLDLIESRLFEAEQLFGSIGASYWVGRCSLARAKALRIAGKTARCRAWLDKAQSELSDSADAQGLEEVGALRRGLDAEIAATSATPGRYAALADSLPLLSSSDRDPGALHDFVSVVADEICADRVVLFMAGPGLAPQVATSVGRTGRRLAEVRRFVRSAAGTGLDRPLVATAVASRALPTRVAAVALIPAETADESCGSWLLYADRLHGDGVTAFSEADLRFMGASVRLLSEALGSGAVDVADREAEDADSREFCTGFITRDPTTIGVIADVARVCESTIPILLLGESGVGKDIVARAVHEASDRPGRFVVLNSGAVPSHLQESELFGHVKGAFTDADRDREGLVETARNGTLFLDEIGDMSLDLQVKLLRFLQSGEYRRVGDSAIRRSNARVVSATNKSLEKAIDSGEFRSDLFYRLSAFKASIPPLRDRRSDVVPLMRHFLAVYSRLEGKKVRGFSDDVVELFQQYDWSGNNVRELENEVRRGVALCDDGDVVRLDHVRPELVALREELLGAGRTAPGATLSLKDEVEALEQCRIREALERHPRNKQEAAEFLGLSRTGLYTKMKKYHID